MRVPKLERSHSTEDRRLFLWCSYCQTFLGESAPFDDFSMSHGICQACHDEFMNNPEAYEITPKTLAARDLFNSMFSRSAEPEIADCRTFLEQAQAAGLNQYDVLIGVLQPALYAVGSKWEAGALTVSQEHEFTSWCEKVLDLLPPTPLNGSCPVLLVCAEGNLHFLGIRLLASYLRKHGVQCRDVRHPLSADDVINLCRRTHPKILGVSVSLAATVPAALRWTDTIRQAVQPETHVVVGGRAFRQEGADGGDHHVIHGPQELLDYLARMQVIRPEQP